MTAACKLEPRDRQIYVVTFAPATRDGGVGGFDWLPDLGAAIARYVRHVKDSAAAGGSHVVRLVPVTIPGHWSDDDVTGEIMDAGIDDECESTRPAYRQTIPAHTPVEWYPVARRTTAARP